MTPKTVETRRGSIRLTFILALALAAAAALSGCGGGASRQSAGLSSATNANAPATAPADARAGGGAAPNNDLIRNASLGQAEPAPTAVERKIIRDATLTLEVSEPARAAERVTSIAGSRGGFVISSESRQESGERGGKAYEVYTVQFRVPAPQFDAALADVRAAGGSVTSEKVAGKDVTEEYIDLEARLRTQRALESQLLDIMKSAREVSDAISVQRELSNVRTEIERIEGRRRFLENQSSLSTINVTLRPPAPLVSTTGFFHSVAEAFGDGVDIAAAITLFLIRALLALIPVVLILGVPAYFILRFLVRRMRRARPAPPPHAQPQDFRPGGPAV
jgi:Domain of unknown function (DUF4349)